MAYDYTVPILTLLMQYKESEKNISLATSQPCHKRNKEQQWSRLTESPFIALHPKPEGIMENQMAELLTINCIVYRLEADGWFGRPPKTASCTNWRVLSKHAWSWPLLSSPGECVDFPIIVGGIVCWNCSSVCNNEMYGAVQMHCPSHQMARKVPNAPGSGTGQD